MLAPISAVPDISKPNTPVIAPSLTKFPLRSKLLPPPVIPAVKVAIEASILLVAPALANVNWPVYV